MLASNIVRAARRVQPAQARSMSNGIGGFLQRNVWKKSGIAYATYVVVGSIICELIYGNVTQGIWDSVNKGVSLPLLVYMSVLVYYFSIIIFRNNTKISSGQSSSPLMRNKAILSLLLFINSF